jgi:hypothetical protein
MQMFFIFLTCCLFFKEYNNLKPVFIFKNESIKIQNNNNNKKKVEIRKKK